MRLKVLLAINVATCLVAGGLLTLPIYVAATSVNLAFAGAGLALVIGITGWSIFKLSRATVALQGSGNTGLAEFDQLLNRIDRELSEHESQAHAESAELSELKELLEKVDRRKGGFDRHGNPLSAAARLRGILQGYGTQLDSNLKRADSCGRELRRAAEEIVTGAESQSDLMNQTTSLVEELSGRIMSICDEAETALKSSGQARDNAENGLLHFRELAEDIKRIRNHVAARERRLQTLGQHTKDIESIVATIGSLSSRTDLLALNASIESVRAGEHGRGFAVVAEEVRALAEQSAQAVVDITSRIELIQRETHQSISGASGEHDQMHDVIARVNDALQSLEQLCQQASDSASGLTTISNDASRQLQLAQQIVTALEHGTDHSQKNRSRAEGANWTAKSLGELSEQIDQSLDLFRLAGAISQGSQTPAALDNVSMPAGT